MFIDIHYVYRYTLCLSIYIMFIDMHYVYRYALCLSICIMFIDIHYVYRYTLCLSIYIMYIDIHYVSLINLHFSLLNKMWRQKLQEPHNRPGVALRVPGGLGSQISMTFGTWRWWDYQRHAPATFIARKFSWYSFSPGAESTSSPWYGRKEYVTEKSSDITGNWSRDYPTNSAAP
jgi:hypothetical protein